MASLLVVQSNAWPPRQRKCHDSVQYYATAFAQSSVANTTNTTTFVFPELGVAFYPNTFRPTANTGGPNVTRGIIWLSEACVDPVAYAPLLTTVLFDGYVAFLLNPTGTSDDDFEKAYGRVVSAMTYFSNQITLWAIGGHGGAGTIASLVAQALYPKIKGLYILAGTIDPDVDLRNTVMTVAVVYGGADSVFNASYVESTRSRYPDNVWFQKVEGAAHSDFAFYNGGRDPAAGATNQTEVFKVLTAPTATPFQTTGGSALRAVLSGLHIPTVMSEALVYAASTSFSTYVYAPGRYYAFVPTANYTTGLVYHVGAFVDPRAYFPSMRAIADKGFLVVIPIMPFSYVSANVTVALGVLGDFPSVTHWVSGGHSLGGVIAGWLAYTYNSQFAGVLFHDAGPITDMSNYTKPVLVSYVAPAGTGARIPPLSTSKTVYFPRLPKTAQFYPIEGANHYQYGWYGYQAPYAPASISREVQTSLIVESAFQFLLQWYNVA